MARCVVDLTTVLGKEQSRYQCQYLYLNPVSRVQSAHVRWVASAVPPSDGIDRKGYGNVRGRGGYGRSRPSRTINSKPKHTNLRDIQRQLVDASDVRQILTLCDPDVVQNFSAVNVSTSLSKMAKSAKQSFTTSNTSRITLDTHPSFVALCERAAELLKSNAYPHRSVCNSAHALATLQHAKTIANVGGDNMNNATPAQSVWKALYAAMPRVEDSDDDVQSNKSIPNTHKSPNPPSKSNQTSARQSTMFLYAAALVKDKPCEQILNGIWKELSVDESRIASHHVSNLVWSLGTLQLDPGPVGWGIIDRCTPTAFSHSSQFNSQNVANTWWGFARLRRAPSDTSIGILSDAICHVASIDQFKPQELANAMWARATLKVANGVKIEPKVRRAFDSATLKTLTNQRALKFKAKELSQVYWHYASLGVVPDDKLWHEVDTACKRQAPYQSPMDVSLVLWACATLDRKPSVETWLAVEKRLRDLVSSGYVGSGPKGISSAHSVTENITPPQLRRQGDQLIEWQQVGNLIWAYAKLRVMPDVSTKKALDDAFDCLAAENGQSMTQQDVSMLLWGMVTLGVTFGSDKHSVRTLFNAVDTYANTFKPDELTNVLWCCAMWRAVGGDDSTNDELNELNYSLPQSYASMWSRLAKLNSSDFTTSDGVLIAHHAALVHNTLLKKSFNESTKAEIENIFPTGLPNMKQSLVDAAQDAWRMQNKQHSDVDAMSRSQHRVATLLKKLGYESEHEYEMFGGDGFFPSSQSVDFYLPEYNLAVEYDGPHHFYDTVRDPKRLTLIKGIHNSSSVNAHTTRNVNTKLRDLFLLRKENVKGVVTLPWWEMRSVKSQDQDKWLKQKIEHAVREVGGDLIESSGGVESSQEKGALVDRWLDSVPASSRVKLDAAMRVADEHSRWQIVRHASQKDTTKVRAALRSEIEKLGE